MERKRIKRYILDSSSKRDRHHKIKNNEISQNVYVNAFNPFNAKIVRV